MKNFTFISFFQLYFIHSTLPHQFVTFPERVFLFLFSNYKEYGIRRNEQTKCTETYKCHNLIGQEIIDKHSQCIKVNLTLSFRQANKYLPSIYWLPKLYKNPCKFRFIIASPVLSLKRSPKTIRSVLKLMFDQTENYNYKCRLFRN